MKISDIFFIIKRRFLEKRNIIFMFVSCFLIFSLLISLTIYHYFNNYEKDDLTRNSFYRTISVSNDITNNQIQEIANLKHVIYIKKSNQGTLPLTVKNFANFKDANIDIKPLLDKNELKIIKGRLPQNANEVVCATKFYPYEVDEKNGFNHKYFIKDKNLLGASFTINYENVTKTLKIVGTYDYFKVMDSMNTCYINEELYNTLVPIDERNDYDIKIDKNENVNEVASILKSMGINPHVPLKNNGEMASLKGIPIFASVLAILISYLVVYYFIKKKIRYHISDYGILKATGYTNKEIYKIELLENTLIFTLCFIITTIIFLIIYYYLINIPYVSYFVFNSSENLRLPLTSFILTYLIIFLLNVICLKFLMKFLINNRSVYDLLEEK